MIPVQETDGGMSATVNINELNPETRARVLERISGTQGTTALATCQGKLQNGKPCNSPHIYIHGFCKRHAPSVPVTTALAAVEIQPSSQLAKLEQARQMLAECRTLPDIKKIRDIAEAAKVYAKAAHLGQEMQNYAAEIALLAERKAGDMFAELERAKPKATGGRVRKSEAKSGYATALEESITSEREAQRWQEIAKIPEETFNDYIQQSKDLKTEISRAGLSKVAKKAANRKSPLPINPPDKPQVSAADITSRLAAFLFELSSLNAFTKQLRYTDLDEPSKAEVQTLITQLRKVSKDADERANRLQEVAS